MTDNKKTPPKKTRAKANEVKGLDLVLLNATKEGFLYLCEQYSQLGNLLKVHAKAVSHPAFAKTDVRSSMNKLLHQYKEIGEQLKIVGVRFDDMGGRPVMFPDTPEPRTSKIEPMLEDPIVEPVVSKELKKKKSSANKQ